MKKQYILQIAGTDDYLCECSHENGWVRTTKDIVKAQRMTKAEVKAAIGYTDIMYVRHTVVS